MMVAHIGIRQPWIGYADSTTKGCQQWQQRPGQIAEPDETDIGQLKADVEVIIGGMLTRVRHTFVRNGRSAGQKMAMITLEDSTGSIDTQEINYQRQGYATGISHPAVVDAIASAGASTGRARAPWPPAAWRRWLARNRA